MGIFWTIGNSNYGLFEGSFFGQLGTTTTAATIFNYGREAAAFLNWAIFGNNNYSREAAAFLKATNNNN
jgi:uncharacterized membrane protein YdjX (TVP38/TMEM64 family)